jgi:hypothetical protein
MVFDLDAKLYLLFATQFVPARLLAKTLSLLSRHCTSCNTQHTRTHTSNSLPPPPPPSLPPLPPLPPPHTKNMSTSESSDDYTSEDEDIHTSDFKAAAQDI